MEACAEMGRRIDEKLGLDRNHLHPLFAHRGFSKRTIVAVVDCLIDAPEQLLFMPEESLKTIPGIGKASLLEIKTYRSRFLPTSKAPAPQA
jgi:hypothetical protein